MARKGPAQALLLEETQMFLQVLLLFSVLLLFLVGKEEKSIWHQTLHRGACSTVQGKFCNPPECHRRHAVWYLG